MRFRTLLTLCTTAVVLAACGGGGGSSESGPNVGSGGTGAGGEVPASAFASVDAFIAFVRQLGTNDMSEPLALPSSPAPTSDSTEPA